MDAVALGSIAAVVITIAIVVFLVVRVVYLMNHTNSKE